MSVFEVEGEGKGRQVGRQTIKFYKVSVSTETASNVGSQIQMHSLYSHEDTVFCQCVKQEATRSKHDVR